MKKILMFFVCCFGVQSVYADLYDVAKVPVSAELTSAREARAVAIQNGETDAFWLLMRKMVAAEELSRIEVPPADEVMNLVQKVSVSNEKTTATKYMADIDVRFYPDKIQQFLKQRQIPFLSKSLPPTVVLPIFEKNGHRLILEDQNPVYTYLKNQEMDGFIIPFGDLEEVALAGRLKEQQTDETVQAFLDRYDVKRGLLLRIKQQGPYVSVQSEVFPDQSDRVIPESFEMMVPSGHISDIMPEIWEKVKMEQEERWRRENTDGIEMPDVFWVQVPITHLADWVAIDRKLKQSDLLKRVEVRGFRTGMVLITLTYKGRIGQLQAHLHKLGLDLTTDETSGLSVLKTLSQGGQI
ncbi:MAG: DUF2066 domain-containing protein [Alphaproteobacteria bacterium]|nr:DUF2066 domain-containing protein [Alphaproteobacteria bacterium]